MHHILKSVLAISSSCLVLLSLVQYWSDQQLQNIYDEEISDFIRRGRHLSHTECSERNIEKFFDCMDLDGDKVLTLVEVLESKKCYKRGRFDAVTVFECIDANKDEAIDYEEALEHSCSCLGL